jgi:integrase
LAAPYLEAERLAKLGVESAKTKRHSLAAYVAEYRKRAALGHALNTQVGVRIACDKFVAYCESRGVTYLQDVGYALCRDWIASRLESGAARSTVVTERSNLLPVWGQALQERAVSENPWLGATVPGKPRREAPEAWTEEEVGRLTAFLDGWLLDMVRVGLNTGIRISALLSLRWTQVDWDAGLIRVRAADSKSGRPYDVPISETCHDALASRLRHAANLSGLIFPSPRGLPYRSRTTFERIRLAVVKSGVPDYGDYNHVLRRTFATLALNSGIPLEVVSKCLDHANLSQTQRAYAHILNKRLVSGMAGFNVGKVTPPTSPEP